MSILGVKDKIGKLVNQLDAHSKESNLQDTSSKFIQPFFESLGWDFNTDVKSENFENSTIKAFQIDNVTRFFLKEFPLNSSLESLNEEIKSCVSYGFNKGVTWVVVTNFKETKVYNTESTGRTLASMQYHKILASEYIENFKNLSDLTKKQFTLNVLDDNAEYFGKKPKRISIDKQLLDDLLSYRNILANDITKENSISENDAEFAAQKILNRLIFIRSCGDRQIENRVLKEDIQKWEGKKDKKLINYLQETFSYFRGRYGSTLFEKHPCDELIISDNVLQQVIEGTYQSKKKAVQYNFAHIEHDSLGKMYENYLGTVQQKKDGAYYTPSYISKYICQNTIIPYLSKSNATEISDLISEYSDNLEELESKINDIKILDPACGTGEFLIRAIDILLEISSDIQAQKEAKGQYQTSDSTSRKAPRSLKKKKSDQTIFQTFDKDIENQQLRKIIQNNIHGVDINEQAIEITQLNMFLKLATSSQQLIDLSKKIRVGNSLIDDPNVDPNAFDWNKEFPDKFDVLVGNPPYVRIQEITKKSKDLARYYKEKDYVSATKNFDLAVLFLEKGSRLLKEGGELGFIMTNKFLQGDYGVGVRKLICKKKILKELIDFGDQQVFSGISTYTCMIFLKNTESDSIKYSLIKKIESILEIIKIIKKEKEMESDKVSIRTINSKELNEQPWMFLNKTEQGIFQKTENMDRLGKISKIFVGLQTSADPVYIVSGKENGKNLEIKSNRLDKKFIVEKELFKPILTGKDAKKWVSVWSEKWILFPYVIGNDNVSIISEKVMSRKFPKTWDYLLKHKKILDKRENGTLRNKKNWHTYVYEKNHTLFHKRKILIGVLSKQSNFSSDEFGKYYFVGGGTAGVYGISLYDEKKYNSNYIIGLLNSSLLDWFVKKKSSKFNNGYFSYAKRFLEDLPICILENNHIIMKIEKIVKNIILNKNIVDNIQDSKKIFQINNNILNDEKEINQLVYELYQITDEEKAIIESSV